MMAELVWGCVCRYYGTGQAVEIFEILVSRRPYLFAKPGEYLQELSHFRYFYFEKPLEVKFIFHGYFLPQSKPLFLVGTDG